jgi:transposase
LPLAPSLHKSASKRASSIQPHALLTLSASQATWLFFRKEEDFKAEEQESLRQLRQASPDLEVTSHLVEEFLHMGRKRTGEQLDVWLNKVEASHLQAFQTVVTGVQNDKEAILAGLPLPWSTGPLEGHSNRGIRSLNEVCMAELSSICSSFECSLRTKRVKRERRRGSIIKNNKPIVS